MSTSSAASAAAPTLKKRVLSLFFRVGCGRQLLLYLYDDDTREAQGMPPRQGGRAGLGLVGRHGYVHQAKKVDELRAAMGSGLVVSGTAMSFAGRTAPIKLASALQPTGGLQPYTLIVEGKYEGGTQLALSALGLSNVRDRNGNAIAIGDLEPDLVQVLPPLRAHLAHNPILPRAYREEVLPDGTTAPIDEANDTRLRLRVIDIKLASEPGAHYFAETVFYSMTLSAWLKQQGLDLQFAVVAAPAVLPGSLEDSALQQAMLAASGKGSRLSAAEASAALEGDLELAPLEAFVPRILQLTKEVIPEVLAQHWERVPIHVDYRCAGCEFLGDPHIMSEGKRTQHQLHCWPEAERSEHLSRVFGLSRGGSLVLQTGAVSRTSELAAAGPTQPAFAKHHGLKAKRTVFPARATSLHQQNAGVIPSSGGDALMPRWPNLHIGVFIDYDPATSFSVTFGCRASWREPVPFLSPNEPQRHRWGKSQGDTEVFLVDKPTLDAERREFLRFLNHLRTILKWVRDQDATDVSAGRRDKKTSRSSYQIYLWDDAQRRHLIRLVSRHLGAILNDHQLRQLAWIFPPPELLADPETATRRTPYTLVFDVIQNTITVPSPHHYTLLDVVRSLVTPPPSPPSVHPLYRDTLSNLTPPERIHEYWTRVTDWRSIEEKLVETTTKKLAAVGMVVSELERRLSGVLSQLSAPPIPDIPRRVPGLAAESYLWLEFAKLNSAVDSLDVDRSRSMPLHEREARFKSALLVRRIEGVEAIAAHTALARTVSKLSPLTDLMIYELAPDSRDLNVRPGEINYALAPLSDVGFLDRHPFVLLKGTPVKAWGSSIDDASLTAVSIAAIDRTAGLIALTPDRRSKFDELAQFVPSVDLKTNVVLDPVHRDYMSPKIELTLRAIGNPSCAVVDPLVARALGLPANHAAGTDAVGPAAEVLWQAAQLQARSSGRDVARARTELTSWLQKSGRVLMPDQWAAFERALGRQLTIIWGPPGTGKSHTLRAVVLGAVLEAIVAKRPLRILLSANTYPAVDNILLKLHADLRDLFAVPAGSARPYRLIRLEGDKRVSEHDFAKSFPDLENIKFSRGAGSIVVDQLRASLDQPKGVLIVGAITHQIHNLAVASRANTKKKKPDPPTPADTQREWFDLILIDEASQMDVASSTLAISKRASNGTCVFAGDDLQLPPIQPAEPPDGLEHVVGSMYNYLRILRNVQYSALNVSFRTNSTLIDFTRNAGYDAALSAHSPSLRLSLDSLPQHRPKDWNASLPWLKDYGLILDPEHPAVCVLYRDRQSGQSNAIEADHIAALATLLRTRMRRDLLNELDTTGTPIAADSGQRFDANGFWERGLGIVVPHRAQMSLVASRLIAAFPNDAPDKIRLAVDTVERFQGQERHVIIAGFGIGDPDIVEAEEEFLFSLRRFNVMASRARAKLVVFVSRTVVEHLSDQADVLTESLLLKKYAEQFCQPSGAQLDSTWELRWR